jgi:alpha-tubulin suppressor-like RCC1 family protein
VRRRDSSGFVALLILAGCGRLGFDPVVDGGGIVDGTVDAVAMDGAMDTSPMEDSAPMDAPMDSSVEDTAVVEDGGVPPLTLSLEGCEPTAIAGSAFECAPVLNREPVVEETLTFTFGVENTCVWAEMNADTGLVSGVASASDDALCELVVGVNSSLGPEAADRLTIVVSAVTDVRQVDIGAWHACAVSTGGAVRCWGSNDFGELGYDDTLDVGNGDPGRSIADMGDVVVGGPVRQISLAYRQTCAAMVSGGVRCWGAGDFERLGYAHTNDVGAGGVGGSIVDNGDLPLGGDAVAVATGGVGGCALMTGGGVRCWGRNHGNGADVALTGAEIAPAGNLAIGFEVAEIAGGYDHYCARSPTGRVRCWGQNWAGALGYDHTNTVGDGTLGMAITDMGDVDVGGTVVQISAGDQTTCAVLDTGSMRCWGWNHRGQLGYGDTMNVGDGTAGRSIGDMGDVPVGGPVRQAWAGEEHTCAVMTTGAVRCWGSSLEGQLGYGDTLNVGDGTPGRAIVDMGDLSLGGTARHVVTTDWDSGFTCAFMTSGGLRCWGNNAGGSLGIDDTLPVGDGTRAITEVPELHPFGSGP